MKTCLLLILAALIMGAAGVYAQNTAAEAVGGAELKLLETIFTGNIGLVMGLIIAIMGIFAFIQGNTSSGITLIVVGVLITLLPGVFNGARLIVCPIALALGGECGQIGGGSGGNGGGSDSDDPHPEES